MELCYVMLGVFAVCLTEVVFAEVVTREPAAAQLHQIFEDSWNEDMRQSPVWASMLGDRRFNDQWQDLSEAAVEHRSELNAAVLKRLESIDLESLCKADRVNYDLFFQAYSERAAAAEHPTHLMPISQRGGIQTLDETGDRLGLQSVQDFEDWLARLERIDVLMDQTIDLMIQGVEQGYVPPKITMGRVPAQIEKQLVARATDSLFYKPFKQMPAAMAASDQIRLQQAAQTVITGKVVPAYEKLYEFFNESYLPACREDIGASSLPNGPAYYESRVRAFTTTDLTPEDVHQIGLTEVARIREEMTVVMKAVAPDTTTAYYTRPAADGSRPGYYWVNLYDPSARPKFEIEVLTVHEAVPGHHLQITLQQELEELPNFRRYSGYTVFTEGWGLYSERLGYDVGLYQDPHSRFGQLSYDMWRAVRLVVDTGMHYKGWTRDEAIAYFVANAPRKKLDIVNEIDRYISWPGQALAYKIGQLKMLELRQRASSALGDGFDLRRFHDRMLENGAIPLSMLEQTMTDWIAAEERALAD